MKQNIETFMGMRVISTLMMVEWKEDWSRVRSPSRARRRMKCGFHQNIVKSQVPRKDALIINGTMYVHPLTYVTLKTQAELEND